MKISKKESAKVKEKELSTEELKKVTGATILRNPPTKTTTTITPTTTTEPTPGWSGRR